MTRDKLDRYSRMTLNAINKSTLALLQTNKNLELHADWDLLEPHQVKALLQIANDIEDDADDYWDED